MRDHAFTLVGAPLVALADRALWAPEARALVVADLHLGKAERIARREGRLTPPYETAETLGRLGDLIDALRPAAVFCLGDSFDDDLAAATLGDDAREALAGLMAGRRWIWVAGNHDPEPVAFGGEHRMEARLGPLTLRHIAEARSAPGEVSGHYHPKAWLRGPGRPAFLLDGRRAILPAFGAYTGGLDVADAAFDRLLGVDAQVLMTGRRIVAAPRAGVARLRGERARRPMVMR